MSIRLSFIKIGFFACAGICCLIIAIILFGNNSFWQSTNDYVLLFETSVNGLEQGSPVKLMGVKIGEVKSILLKVERETHGGMVPVIVSINNYLLNKKDVSGLISNGLLGRLEYQSYLTGRLFIELDYSKGINEKRNNSLNLEQCDTYLGKCVIPTGVMNLKEMSRYINKVLQKISKIDIENTIKNFEATSNQIRKSFADLETAKISEQYNQTVEEVQKFLKSGLIQNCLESATKMFEKVDKSLGNDSNLNAHKIHKFFDESIHLIENFNNITNPTGDKITSLENFLESFTKLSRELSDFLSYLKQNPNALITGLSERKRQK